MNTSRVCKFICTKDKFFTFVQLSRTLFGGVGRWTEELNTALKQDIEDKWHSYIQPSVQADNKKEKYYVLSMFPYPSGKLHMGHVRVYTISDTVARFHRMNGKNVIHPMGWDAFGLPAENAAIERGIHPRKWTQQNIKSMKKQLKTLGCSFDWNRELATCDPQYYKWTQYMFLKLYDAGLIYQKESSVNWDPVDQTVLADEQVDENGNSWRSGAKVEKKVLKQWFIRTTYFSKSLLDGLHDPSLENWRDIIKLQKHWLGDCNGTNIEFKLESTSDDSPYFNNKTVTTWTQRPELVFAARFISVAPNSVLDKIDNQHNESNSNSSYRRLSARAYNPFTGEYLPIFVTNNVKYQDGTDTHLGVPAVSESDREFAIAANLPTPLTPEEDNSLFCSKDDVQVTREHVCQSLKQHGAGGYPSSSKLRDWLISRQRYWGTPIPIIHCDTCGPQPVPVEELPVILPDINFITNKGVSPLEDATDWLKTTCPKCSGNARRETDTMDTFVDSSWYFLRYLDPCNSQEAFSKESVSASMPVDLYIGGKEHAVLHLYYARFFTHFLHSIGMVPCKEPFKKLLVQGMVMGKTYRVKETGRYIPESDVDLTGRQLVEKATGQSLITSWEKMSKSKHNGVDPESMFRDYGTDTTRLLILADVSPISHRNWDTSTFPGILNWQNRLWLTVQNFIEIRSQLDTSTAERIINTPEFEDQESKLFDSRNFYIKGATFNYNFTYLLSVALSRMQGLTNSIRKASNDVIGFGLQYERALAAQIIMLAPMSPHFASELWSGFLSAPHRINVLSEEICWEEDVLNQTWPEVDRNYCLDLVCKVNGVENCAIKLPRYELDNLTHDDALELALSHADVQHSTASRKIINTNFILHPSYEAVIKIKTEKVDRKKRTVRKQDA